MKYKLYVDDIRYPKGSGFIIVRNYEDFIYMINEFGCPEFISFDHDLGDNSPTGYDCLKWLIEKDLNENSFLIEKYMDIHVHSANPVGAKNIMCLWTSYMSTKQ